MLRIVLYVIVSPGNLSSQPGSSSCYRLASTDRHVRVRHAPERDCGPTWCRRHAPCLSAARSACLSTDHSVAALPIAVGSAPAAATNTAAAMRAAAPSGAGT